MTLGIMLILKRMLSKYTFLAPNLIRVSREGADYAHLITCASPWVLNSLPPIKCYPCILLTYLECFLVYFFGTKTGQGGGVQIIPTFTTAPPPTLRVLDLLWTF